MLFDTIVAPITGNQMAAVAIVRVSGSDSWRIAKSLIKPWPEKPQNHHAVYGSFKTGDDGMALPFADGHGYTGEESVEFTIHGSPASIRALVEACRAEGARMAEPGEFTQRAFLNGNLDLTQAEGVRDTIEAETDAQLRQATLHRGGVLSRTVSEMREALLGLLIRVEASVDFSEEIGDLDRKLAEETIATALANGLSLLRTAPAGRILRNGLRVAIVGPPNAGKSSLLNALLGIDRSIVTEVAGTTRDYVEEQVEIGGVKCILVDTAGLRESKDRIESIGIQRSRTIAASADEVWYVYDLGQGWTQRDEDLAHGFGRPVLILANKLDLSRGETRETHLAISTVTRAGFEALIEHVAVKIHLASSGPLINSRHEASLVAAQGALEICLGALRNNLPDDLLSVGLRDATDRLGEITGETAAPDMIDRIFHDFCIGK